MLPWKLKTLPPSCSVTSCIKASWPPACSQQSEVLLCTDAGTVMVQVRHMRLQVDLRGLPWRTQALNTGLKIKENMSNDALGGAQGRGR